MKLSARKKVANGLVLCLLAPGVTATVKEFASDVEEGLGAFSASDDFDLVSNDGTLLASRAESMLNADPSGGDPSGGGGDPSGGGGDPSGGDPSACVPQTEPPKIEFSTSRQQTSVSDGQSGILEVALASSTTDEVSDFQNDPACTDITIEVAGPETLLPGENGLYLVRMVNMSSEDAIQRSLTITPAVQVNVDHYAATLLSGNDFGLQVESAARNLHFSNVSIPAGDMLVISLELSMAQVHHLFDFEV
jgi:hypothetical protein